MSHCDMRTAPAVWFPSSITDALHCGRRGWPKRYTADRTGDRDEMCSRTGNSRVIIHGHALTSTLYYLYLFTVGWVNVLWAHSFFVNVSRTIT